MMLYSVSVAIEFVRSKRELEACMTIELCAPSFSLFWFVVDVSFWFIVLFVLMTWILRIEQGKSHQAEHEMTLSSARESQSK
jgi:hypothetical protein